MSYRTGEHLMRQGELGDCVIVLRRGVVATLHDHNGDRRLLGVCGPGELLGDITCVDGGPRSASLVARGPVSGVKVARSRFLEFLDGSPVVAREVIRQTSVRMRAVEYRQLASLSQPVDQRVLHVLVELVELLAAGRHAVDLPFNQQEIAQLAAAKIAATHRALTALRDCRLIATGYRKIEVPCVRELRAAAGKILPNDIPGSCSVPCVEPE